MENGYKHEKRAGVGNGCCKYENEEEPCCFSQTLKSLGQGHLLKYWNGLTEHQRFNLKEQISSLLPLDKICSDFQKAMKNSEDTEDLGGKMHQIEPQYYTSEKEVGSVDADIFWTTGLSAIAHCEVGVILLAGGQGTRLGVAYPKGMYDVGLPSKKTLYQLQAERILRLQSLAKQKFPETNPTIYWYIMTSEATRDQTQEFFEKHSFFGLNESQIVFFEQGVMPCFTFGGKIIMDKEDRIAMAPDGNGGLYKALLKSGCLANMESRGVKYLHVYCVDNILVRVADPMFLGYCISKQADCGNKVVEKVMPHEPVGVVCTVEGVGVRVVEYSEIPKSLAETIDPNNGKLLYRAGNIANHFFTVDFVRRICNEHEEELIYHVAKKKIPFIDEDGTLVHPKTPNGVKLEKFVFDVFQFSKKFYVWEVTREEEFSPLKNAQGVDSPTTCRDDVFRLHRRWIESAGGNIVLNSTITDNNNDSVEDSSESDSTNGTRAPPPTPVQCEISPLISYRGEDLAELLKSKEKLGVPLLL